MMESSATEFYDNFTVESETDDGPRTDFILMSFGIFGIIANGFVLVVIGCTKDLQSGTNLLIANQSLIDFAASLLLLALQVVPASLPVHHPRLARFICGFWMSWSPFYMAIAGSVANLILITVERLYAIMSPIRYRQNMNTRRILLLSIIPWLYGFCFEAYSYAWVRVEGAHCYIFQWPNDQVRQIVGITLFVLNLVIPTAVIAIIYGIIARILRQDTRVQSTKNDYRESARRNIIKTLFIVCICYLVCWAPIDVIHFYDAVMGKFNFGAAGYNYAILLAFANMWINPIIYSFRYKQFQKAVLKVCCIRRPRPRKSQTATSSISAKTQSTTP